MAYGRCDGVAHINDRDIHNGDIDLARRRTFQSIAFPPGSRRTFIGQQRLLVSSKVTRCPTSRGSVEVGELNEECPPEPSAATIWLVAFPGFYPTDHAFHRSAKTWEIISALLGSSSASSSSDSKRICTASREPGLRMLSRVSYSTRSPRSNSYLQVAHLTDER